MKNENKKACKYIVEHYGLESQLRILAEECSELAIEALKSIRFGKMTSNFTSEVADVIIMIEQIKIADNIPDEFVERFEDLKIKRQLERIEAGL